MQSSVRQALYIGMTNNLHRRIFEHKMRRTEGFTDDYNATRLVYWESFDDVYKAIVREKQLKNCRRLAKGEEVVADRAVQSGGDGSGCRLVPGHWRNTRSLDFGMTVFLDDGCFIVRPLLEFA
jgi:putative endonuclease